MSNARKKIDLVSFSEPIRMPGDVREFGSVNGYVVNGYFPAGRVRGVSGFEFVLSVKTGGDRDTIRFERVVVNGVALRGDIFMMFKDGAYVASVPFMSQVKLVRNNQAASDAAARSLSEVGNIIAAEMMDSECVSSMICKNAALRAKAEREDLETEIKYLQTQLENARAELANFRDLDGIKLGTTGLKVVMSVMSGGASYDEALIAADALVNNGN